MKKAWVFSGPAQEEIEFKDGITDEEILEALQSGIDETKQLTGFIFPLNQETKTDLKDILKK